MGQEKVPKFDTTMTDALSAASEGIDLEQMKAEFQEAGFNCVVMPAAESVEPLRYAFELDIIAVLEKCIMGFEDHIEELDIQRKIVENSLRWEIEVRAEDKNNGLTNEIKRKLAYEQLALENEELQKLCGELRIFRSQAKRLRIEQDNELRAFQLKISEGRQAGGRS